MKSVLKLDWLSLISIFLLLSIGMVALYSVSFVNNDFNPEHFGKQFISIAIGLILMIVLSLSDYRVLNNYSSKMYFAALIFLGAVFLFGTTVRGTTGWISLGGFNIQPVEIVKLITIIFLASFLSKKRTELAEPIKIIASLILVGIPVILILNQPDFGSASVIIGIWIGMLLTSGISRKSVIALVLLGVIMIFSGYFFLKDYQKERLINFVNPYNDPRGSGYNVIQSIVAVGSGGFFGKGLGHGSQSQLNFLPEKHTDFIFAVVAEEMGFFGAMIILLLFGIVFFRLKETAKLARDNFGYLISVGVMVMIFFQVLINIGMNVGIAPVAGVPLPFLSYGGSSLVAVLASMGIVQSIYSRKMKII